MESGPGFQVSDSLHFLDYAEMQANEKAKLGGWTHVKETTQQPEAPPTTGNKSVALRRCLIRPLLGSVPRLAPCRFFVSNIFLLLR